MMNEEKYLIQRVGKENPFRVPDDYFSTLASEVMTRVDAADTHEHHAAFAQRKARQVWMRPLLYAAASVCALFISVTAYRALSGHGTESTAVHQIAATQQPDDSFDEAADYMMVDNEDIYACLSSD